jgi:hypothetical protein
MVSCAVVTSLLTENRALPMLALPVDPAGHPAIAVFGTQKVVSALAVAGAAANTIPMSAGPTKTILRPLPAADSEFILIIT